MKDGSRPGEFDLIERFRSFLPERSGDLVVGPGDDCAAVALGESRLLLLTCDALVENRHFVRAKAEPARIGRRLAAVNLSDVAAMGGWPRFALLSLVLPDDAAETWAEALARGVSEMLGEHGASLVGGNLSGTGDAIVADLSLLGEVERDRVLLRSGAREGDALLVTGHLGASAAGLRLLASDARKARVTEELVRAHSDPSPRLAEGRVIAESDLATSMIDLSDGLASDLAHVCRESGVGAEVVWTSLPVHDDTRRVASELGLDLHELVLAGGEDYELLFTVPDDVAGDLAGRVHEATGTPVTRIGRIAAPSSGVRVLDESGGEIKPTAPGWDHFRRSG